MWQVSRKTSVILKGMMTFTSQDLQAIKGLLQEQKLEILTEVQQMQIQQTKEISQVINQALSTVDEIYATKAEVAELRQEFAHFKRSVALAS